MKILVTVTNYSKYCKPGKQILLDAGYEIIENPNNRPFTFYELEGLVKDIDGVVCGVDDWNESILLKAPKLKGIARFGVGVDNIDLESAKNHKIMVSNCPGINSAAVAEQTITLMLSLLRRVPELNNDVHEGKWTRPMFHELKSQTIGLLGFGRIAQEVAKRLKPFNAKIIAYDKYPNEEKAKSLDTKLLSLEEVLTSSDILSLHLPANEETFHIINKESIAIMKSGTLIINTSRGSTVNEKEVYEALASGKLGGMATDVFETEPIDFDNPLFSLKNFIATPHVSAETYENCEETSVMTAKAVIEMTQGRNPQNRVV